MTLTSLLCTEYNQSHLRVARKKKYTKLNFYSCPTARDRSLGMRVYLCVYIHTQRSTTIGKCIDFLPFLVLFFFFSLLVFFSFVPIIRATVLPCVYPYEADGGTRHRTLDFFDVCISVCLIYGGKKITRSNRERRNVQSSRKEKKKKERGRCSLFCSVFPIN